MPSSRNLNKITLRLCSELSEAEILLRKIPQDDAAGHVPEILNKIKQGQAKVYTIQENESKAGVLIYEIYDRKLHILAVLADRKISIAKTVWPQIKLHAAQAGCESISFDTVRAGLVALSLDNGFYISSVVMRCPL